MPSDDSLSATELRDRILRRDTPQSVPDDQLSAGQVRSRYSIQGNKFAEQRAAAAAGGGSSSALVIAMSALVIALLLAGVALLWTRST